MKHGYIGTGASGNDLYNIGTGDFVCITGQTGWDDFLDALDKRLKEYLDETNI